jgi:mono/diheme cytochrome c family protein
VTEVPEHLLKRSRDRRAALGLGGGDGGDSGGGEETSAASASSAVESAAPAGAAARPAAVEPLEVAAPPRRVPKYVRASLERKRIPLWVMPVLAFLPIWGVIYVNTLSKPYSNVPTQLVDGATVFSSCSSCHGSNGEGGAGRQLNEGQVLLTFPHLADQLEFVWQGDVGTGIGNVYGDPNRPGGAHKAGDFNGGATLMPAWNGALTQAQLLDVVRHERETLSGQTVPPKQIADDGSLLWPNLTPVLNPTTGLLQNPDGTVMLDPTTGKLTNPQLVDSAAGNA